MSEAGQPVSNDGSMPAPRADSEPLVLADWLAYVERLHAKPIDMGLDRVREVATRLGLRFDSVVITVAGTNGKGSTCKLLESILLAAGYRVAAYIKPHLIRFNERARVNGRPLADDGLLPSFHAVEVARSQTPLTYFEFTTLAILHAFGQARPDVTILEVGLGGRLDAVNLIDADCSIVTSIDIDHADYLGDTREKIGWEKAHVFRPGRPAICSDPNPPASVAEYARSIGADFWQFGRDFNFSGDRQQWSYGGRGQRRVAMAYPALRGANQLLNASGALAALEALRQRLPVSQQAVREGLALVTLPGRFQIIPGRPAIVLDVAHNPHAASHLAQNLNQQGFFPYTWAVFGAMRDKDIEQVALRLRDRIDHWMITDLHSPRAAAATELAQVLQAIGVRERGASVQLFANPVSAFAAARAAAGENDRILVFGSFITVGQVMEHLRISADS